MEKTLMDSLSKNSEVSVDRSEWSPRRRWRVTITYRCDIFLTTQEKDYLVGEVAKGKRIIRVGEMILTNKFLSILPVGQIPHSDAITVPKLTPEERKKSIDAAAGVRETLIKKYGFNGLKKI